MLAKPLALLCVFLLTITNFIVLLTMLSLLFFPFFLFFHSIFIEFGFNLFFYLISRISGAVILYITIDSIFGITVRRCRKGCTPFSKATNVYMQSDIITSFEWLKERFKMRKVKLYLDPSIQVANAYAVGSFSGSVVMITLGLLNQIQNQTRSPAEYLDGVRGILGHEMSHLINKDFIPGLLTNASETVNGKISMVARWFFVLFASIFRIVPVIGRPISKFFILAYNFVNLIIMAFFTIIFMPIYDFLQKIFSRSIEYRSDRESAYVYGGNVMATGLSTLGKGGYFSLFSTHPATTSRISRVKSVLPKGGSIRPGIVNIFSNLISIALVLFIFTYSTQMANVPNMYDRYLRDVYTPAMDKITWLKNSYLNFKETYTGQ